MKRNYQKPNFEMQAFACEDILAVSGVNDGIAMTKAALEAKGITNVEASDLSTWRVSVPGYDGDPLSASYPW